jgi:ABC-2 type transport system permease protein
MSRVRAIRLVATRELLERGRSRAFLISVVTSVGLLAIGAIVPSLTGGPGVDHVGIAGTPPAQFAPDLAALSAATNHKAQIEPIDGQATGEARLRDGSLSAVLIVAPDGSSARYIVKSRRDELLAQIVSQAWSAARSQQLLMDKGIDPTTLAAAAVPPAMTELEPSDPNRDTSFLFANVGVILLFISIFTFGYWVLSGVVEEKQSRVVEVVLSTVEARDLLIGKVIGIGLLGLGQLIVMVAIGLSLGLVLGRFTLPPTTGGAIAQLLLWFILGYALYSTALGALGALASRIEEASNASTPVTFVAMGAYFFALLVVLDNPGGLPARIGSFIPPIAPMVVPLRAALGAVEPWEVVVSAAITIAAIWGMFVLGGRIYSGAVLRSGGRMKLLDAWRSAEK